MQSRLKSSMIKNLTIPIYDRTVIFHCGERDELENHLARHFKNKALAHDVADHVSWENLGCVVGSPEINEIVIHLHKIPDDCEMSGVLAHEIFHAAVNVASTAGIKLTDESDEVYAYIVGYITKMIYKELETNAK